MLNKLLSLPSLLLSSPACLARPVRGVRGNSKALRKMRTKCIIVLSIALLLSSPAWAAINHDGNCYNASTSCTLTATATGDLKIVIAVHAGQITPPTLPAGWTQIATVATPNSGAIRAATIGCNVSSSSGDTGTGTWTGATNIIAASYSGTGVGTTGNCNTTGIGAFATDQAQTSTTINFDAITLHVGSGSSWVIGACHSSGTACGTAPTNMTIYKNGGTGLQVLNDTNAGVTAWTLQTLTVTSGTWLTFVGEILASSAGVVRHRAQVIQSP
jgi:hypothetical protein